MSKSNAAEEADLARQQLQLDIELKRSELDLRRTERRLREDEHALKAKEVRESSWKNPLVVAVLAAAVAGTGNAIVAVVNNDNLRALEESKAQSSLIIDALKTGDPDRASVVLQLLLDASLITDTRAEGIREYLRTRRPGQGAALPASSDRFRIEGAANLPVAARTTLNQQLASFVAYLDQAELRTPARQVRVVIDRDITADSYFDRQTGSVRVAADIASDPFATLWAYAQFALQGGGETRTWRNVEALALLNGLSDYFPASFLDQPRVGVGIAAAVNRPDPFLRNLENRLSYRTILAQPGGTREADRPHALGEAWGGAFWEMRSRLGRERADRLFAQAWLAARRSGEGNVVATFVRSLASAAGGLGQREAAIVDSILRARELPRPSA